MRDIIKFIGFLLFGIFYNNNNNLNLYKYENSNTILHSHIINLDLPPFERWKNIMNLYETPVKKALNTIKKKSFIFTPFINRLKQNIKEGGGWSEENIEEMQGIANYTNTDYGLIETVNLFYEWSPGCTSIIAQKYDNSTIIHARNYDMSLSILSEILLNLVFIKNGRILYKGNGFAGYIGLTTAMRPGRFSISSNSRFQGSGYFGKYNFFEKFNYFESIKAAKAGGKPIGVFVRDLVENNNTFTDVINILKKQILINVAYYTIAGVNYNEGAIVTRNRFGVDNSYGENNGIWKLNASTNWWRLITNFDHWWIAFDRRRSVANKQMEKIGFKNITLNNMDLVLTKKPVLASDTIFTTFMNPKTGEYTIILR